MGLADDRAMLQGAVGKIDEATAKLLSAYTDLEEATGMAAAAIQGFDNVTLTEALGMIAQASDTANDAVRAALGAKDNLESYIGRMSG